MSGQNPQKKAAIAAGCLIVLLFAVSMAAILLMNGRGKKPASTSVVCVNIYQNGSLIKTVKLADTDEPYSFTITGDDGCYNTITVKNGTVGVTDASCPDKLCMNMGFISASAIPIICLPNHIVIEFTELNEFIATPEGSGTPAPDGLVY